MWASDGERTAELVMELQYEKYQQPLNSGLNTQKKP